MRRSVLSRCGRPVAGAASLLVLTLAVCWPPTAGWAASPTDGESGNGTQGRGYSLQHDHGPGPDRTSYLFGEVDSAWEAAAGIDPDEPMSSGLLLDLSRQFLDERRLDDALAATRASLSVNPESAVAWAQLGEIYSRTKNFEEAESSFNRALALDGANDQARLGICLNLIAAGLPADAEKQCRSFMANNGTSPELLLVLGEALEDQDKLQEAFICYGKALMENPQYAPAHSRRGRLFCRHHQFEAAAFECRAALAIDPDDKIAHAYLAFALANMDQDDDAMDHATQAQAAGMNMSLVWRVMVE
jgi:tetratricopeptide (TPR) repeat protein